MRSCLRTKRHSRKRARGKRASLRNKRHVKFCGALTTSTAEDDLLYLLLKKEMSDIESLSLKQKVDAFLSDPANASLIKGVITKISVTEHANAPKPPPAQTPAVISKEKAAIEKDLAEIAKLESSSPALGHSISSGLGSIGSSISGALGSDLTSALSDPLGSLLKVFT